MDWDSFLTLIVVAVAAVYLLLKLWDAWTYKPSGPEHTQYGEITLETLEMFAGFDPYRPILLAVKGRVYNVTEGSEFYGRGGAYAAMAGKECARALAKMRLEAEDFTDDVSDCTDKELGTLHDWIVKLNAKYPVVGKIVPGKKLTLEELRQYSGSDPSKPMYLAISGVIYDVTSAPQYYGPDGIYPFAGHECARAFALVSLETEDCTSNLEGLTKADLEQLKEWECKFRFKYNVIGHVVASE